MFQTVRFIFFVISFDFSEKSLYSQTCLKGSPQGTHKNWLLETGDPLIQVHLRCILAKGLPKKWLLKTGDPLIQLPLKTGLTVIHGKVLKKVFYLVSLQQKQSDVLRLKKKTSFHVHYHSEDFSALQVALYRVSAVKPS